MAKTIKKPSGYANYPGGYRENLTPAEARAFNQAEKKNVGEHAAYIRKMQAAGFVDEAKEKRAAGVGVWTPKDSTRAANRLNKALADSAKTAKQSKVMWEAKAKPAPKGSLTPRSTAKADKTHTKKK